MSDRAAAKKRIGETVKLGPNGFMWVELIRDVAGDLKIDLGKHAKTAPEHARSCLIGRFPNRKDSFAEVVWDDPTLELCLKLMELGIHHAIVHLPVDPPKPEPVAGAEGEKKPKKARPAPPKPPAAPAPPAVPA